MTSPKPPARDVAVYLIAIAASVAAAMIIAALIARHLLERAEDAWIAEVRDGQADPLSPADLSALDQEARAITRDAADRD